MKKFNTILFIIAFSSFGFAQNSMEERIQAIEDKMAIKKVVDVFSNLADTKEIDKQVMLFTEDGTVESFMDGKSGGVLKGRKQLQEAFSGFLSGFQMVYHQNGQQTIDELTSNAAKATSYCRVILISEQNEKKNKTTFYIIYKDEFVKQNGTWLIEKRTSNFNRTEREEVK